MWLTIGRYLYYSFFFFTTLFYSCSQNPNSQKSIKEIIKETKAVDTTRIEIENPTLWQELDKYEFRFIDYKSADGSMQKNSWFFGIFFDVLHINNSNYYPFILIKDKDYFETMELSNMIYLSINQNTIYFIEGGKFYNDSCIQILLNFNSEIGKKYSIYNFPFTHGDADVIIKKKVYLQDLLDTVFFLKVTPKKIIAYSGEIQPYLTELQISKNKGISGFKIRDNIKELEYSISEESVILDSNWRGAIKKPKPPIPE